MPATAGRVRMPANNRVHSSAALQTHGIWQSAIGYDPYAPTKDQSKVASHGKSEEEPDNPYESFKGLILLARMTASNTDETRGSCRKCGRGGHLTYQCRNFLSVKDDEKDTEAIDADIMAELGKIKGSMGKFNGQAGAESLEETESSDSSEDSELERAITERFRKKKVGSKLKSSKKKDQTDDSGSGRRKKRRRSTKRSGGKRSEIDSDDDGHGKRRKEKRRRDESSDDEECRRQGRKSRKEKRRRRSHRYSYDSEDSEESPRWHKRRAKYDSDVNDSDDSTIGRHSKRSDNKSRK